MRSRRRAPEEIDHDFLWRSAVRLPERGRIGIFNRSHYEEVLVVRVHPDLLARQKLPPSLMGKAHLGASLQEHPRLRAPSCAQRNGRPQILPAHLARGAAPAPAGAARRAGQALEVQCRRHRRAQALGQIHGGLRGHDPRNQPRRCAVVRRAGRQQAVRAAGRGAGDRGRALAARPQISEGRRRRPQGDARRSRRRLLEEGPPARVKGRSSGRTAS